MIEILKDGFSYLGISASDDIFSKFQDYADFLVAYNEKVNLTAITDPADIAVKHFLDSLTPISQDLIKKGDSMIDVGCGAGFPSIPMKLVFPDMELTLLDSLDKRLAFLKELCRRLDIAHVSFVHARAEDGGKQAILREKYDVAVSRAVANLRVLSEYCLPFVKVGGLFLALKGPSVMEEAENAKKAIDVLGGELVDIKKIELPFSELTHTIVVIKKVRQTPMQYPRKAGKPAKSPI